jgi:hypothetical protein
VDLALAGLRFRMEQADLFLLTIAEREHACGFDVVERGQERFEELADDGFAFGQSTDARDGVHQREQFRIRGA